jgi:methanogenic corrinoid protein MtbC1
MIRFVTLKQLAEATGVSESSLKRWSERGVLTPLRTPGGHRRLPLHEAIQFLRERSSQGAAPAALGIPASAGFRDLTPAVARRNLLSALRSGDLQTAAETLIDLHLGGRRVSVIGDEVLAPAFHEIGELWGCGDVRVYEERRACELGLRALGELGECLPPPPAGAPLAIGATPEGDHYAVALTASELVLREAGWRTRSLGSSVPAPAILSLLEEQAPELLWLSATHLEDEDRFVREMEQIFHAGLEGGTALAIGGQALHPALRRRLSYGAFCDSFQRLEQFAATIHSAATKRRGASSDHASPNAAAIDAIGGAP